MSLFNHSIGNTHGLCGTQVAFGKRLHRGGKVYILKSQGHLEQNTTISKSNVLWEISFLSPPHTHKVNQKRFLKGTFIPGFIV